MANFIRHVYVKKNTSFGILKPILSTSLKNQRNFSSILFIPGNKANTNFAYLFPNIDGFNDYFANVQKAQKELDQRGVKVDVQELSKTWEYYQYVLSNRNTLEIKLAENNKELAKFYQIENPSPDEIKNKEHFQHQCKLIKQDLKPIKEAVWKLEESVIPQILKLPNQIDERTPIDNSLVLKSIGDKPIVTDKIQSHMEIGKNLGLLEYKNPIQCYLCDKAALFELEALALAGNVLNEMSFVRVAGPDFNRSIIVEGCGIDHENPTETFIMQNNNKNVKDDQLINNLHLMGGASLASLLAMYTKHTFKPYDFPLRIFSTGRQYTPFPNAATAHGLFSVCQASAVQTLVLIDEKESEEYKTEFEKLIETASRIYDEIDCHYRIVIRSVKELSLSESMRISFEMWSVHANQYVEVGHVSAYGDYFSRRLMMTCPTKNCLSYPTIISGTLLSVPRVLGCLLEQDPDKFVISENLSRFV